MDKEKKKYLFLVSIVIIGIIIGILFANILNNNDRILVNDKITNFFINIKDNKDINYLKNFKNIFLNNITYITLIWLLGLSIIGIVCNIFILFFKSFTIGFSIGSIIYIYLYKGILGSFLYIFPHTIINIFIMIILVYYANNLSIKLFKLLFLKKDIKFNELIKKYSRIYLYSLGFILISSILETFIQPLILKLFTFLID